MEFEDQEDHDDDEEVEEGEEEEEEMGIRTGYDSLGDVSRVKMTASSGETEAAVDETTAGGFSKARYRECLKNHAVGIGGHAVDGCGEFMAAGAEGTLDALKCAACNCHRNFHRKESNDSLTPPLHGRGTGGELSFHGSGHGQLIHHHHPHYQVPQYAPPYYRPPTGYLHVATQQQRPLALPSTSGGGEEQEEDVSNPNGGGGGGGGSSRKRVRTKFSQEQKERMVGLAERLGWRIQRHDEELVQHFCNEIGIKRNVFKVWMHNNKNTLGGGKKP